jgi:hypothetical protein
MSKLGVGVGEDFPVDDTAPNPEQSDCAQEHFEAWREQRRQWRKMRHEWRAKRAAMREQFRARYGHRHGPDDGVCADERHQRHVHHVVLGALALIGLAALFGAHRDHS